MIFIRRFGSVFVIVLILASFLIGCNEVSLSELSEYGKSKEVSDDPSVSSDINDILTTKKLLKFNKNGEFRILITSDIQDVYPLNEDTIKAFEILVEKEKPDLILFAGDNSLGFTDKDMLKKYVSQMVAPAESRRIPWAHVYGNHDTENLDALTRDEHQEVYESFGYCISKRGDSNIHGVSNFVLPIYSSNGKKLAFNVWALDSGSYLNYYRPGLKSEAVLPNPVDVSSIYEYIHFDQIKWYWDTSVEIEKFCGQKIPSIMFFHIPIPEFYAVAENPDVTGRTGKYQQVILAPAVNSGLFAAVLDRGDVLGIYCGHSHLNDFAGKYCGIELGYTANISFGTYHDEEIMGVRMIVINESDPYNYKSYMSYLKDTEFFDNRE